MKTTGLITLCLCLCFVISSAPAQKMKSAAAPTTARSKNRLPNYYGQIGLSDEQRTKIYGIQAEFRTKSEELIRQLEDMRTEETLEIQSVLTPEQRTELNDLVTAARKKRQSS
ncbi:MAG TPA: hypothetical protein DD473_09175 [Planctomycetaceae bacterium]|nr:hypothetical protein [Planctomycetaceae bacterium]